jgi:hypothetical protein
MKPDRAGRAALPELALLDDLGREIQAALREDITTGGRLSYEPSRDRDLEFDGYCAVASEAYFYLTGAALAGLDPADSTVDWERAGKKALEAGLQPMQLTRRERHGILRRGEDQSHWWIDRTAQGNKHEVIDLTIGPHDDPGDDYSYSEGNPKGFMMHGYKRPGKTRCLPLIAAISRKRRDVADDPPRRT